MKQGQLDKKFQFGLKWFDLGGNKLHTNSVFKYKNFEKLTNPEWPLLIQFFN